MLSYQIHINLNHRWSPKLRDVSPCPWRGNGTTCVIPNRTIGEPVSVNIYYEIVVVYDPIAIYIIRLPVLVRITITLNVSWHHNRGVNISSVI